MSESEDQSIENRIRSSLDIAYQQYEAVMDERFTPEPTLAIDDDPEFSALIEPDDNGYRIHVSTGTIGTFDLLWSEALRDPELLATANTDAESLNYDPVNLADVSMVWLFLHELMHLRLGHFDLAPESCKPESQAAWQYSLVGRRTRTPALLRSLSLQEQEFVSPCLELQADHEAIDIMLDVYGDDRWEELRVRAACIYAVMALIEREDRGWETPGGTHPQSSTRFFMMIGHLFQMWSHRDAELEASDVGSRLRSGKKLSPEAFQDYAGAVLSPSINDAIILAATAKANSFLQDVGGESALLQDLWTVQYAEELSAETLKSDAAKEWLRLTPINDKIMALAGLR